MEGSGKFSPPVCAPEEVYKSARTGGFEAALPCPQPSSYGDGRSTSPGWPTLTSTQSFPPELLRSWGSQARWPHLTGFY